jgi:hypothetical protein
VASIGIYGVSSQSGVAFLADLIEEGMGVYGFARPSEHGRGVVEAIRSQDGVQLDRPENRRDEKSRFVPLLGSEVGHNVKERPVPLVLSPSRTLPVPYLWQTLGDGYPIVSFQTSPYACKCFRPGSVWIKRRKRAWIASAEGRVAEPTLALLRSLFPNIVFTHSPAAASLGNIGAVFHPTPYLLNLQDIRAAEAAGRPYSFYMEGIAHNPVVGPIVEEIDQIRLRIADAFGCPVFGLRERPREEEWAELMRQVHELEQHPLPDVKEHRRRGALL